MPLILRFDVDDKGSLKVEKITKDMKSLGGEMDKTSTKSSVMGKALGVAAVGVAALGAGIVTTVRYLSGAISSFSEAEKGVIRLDVALRNQGDTSRISRQDIINYAAELQNATGISNDLSVAAAATLTTFGLQGDEMKRALKAAQDLSVEDGNLIGASELLGKAFAGETSMLRRHGIIIDENIPKSERYAEAIKQIERRFGGMADEIGRTDLGKLDRIGEELGDMKEALGQLALDFISPFLDDASEGTLTFKTALEQLRPEVKAIAQDFKFLYDKVKPLFDLLNMPNEIKMRGAENTVDSAIKKWEDSVNRQQEAKATAAIDRSKYQGIIDRFKNTPDLSQEEKASLEQFKKHVEEIKRGMSGEVFTPESFMGNSLKDLIEVNKQLQITKKEMELVKALSPESLQGYAKIIAETTPPEPEPPRFKPPPTGGTEGASQEDAFKQALRSMERNTAIINAERGLQREIERIQQDAIEKHTAAIDAANKVNRALTEAEQRTLNVHLDAIDKAALEEIQNVKADYRNEEIRAWEELQDKITKETIEESKKRIEAELELERAKNDSISQLRSESISRTSGLMGDASSSLGGTQFDSVFNDMQNMIQSKLEYEAQIIEINERLKESDISVAENYRLTQEREFLIAQRSVQTRTQAMQTVGDLFMSLSQMMEQRGKKGAAMAKAFAITGTIINTASSAMAIFQQIASTPGLMAAALPLAIAGAAVTTAMGMAKVAMIASQKYHTGGIVGKPQGSGQHEVDAVLLKDERVLNAQDSKRITDIARWRESQPRLSSNAPMKQEAPQVTVQHGDMTLVLDKRVMQHYLDSPDGERQIYKMIRKERGREAYA